MTTASRILSLIKTEGPKATLALAADLGVTRQAARQQLERLEADGLVLHDLERGGVGRPRRVWSLTEAAQARFPDGHAEALADVLEGVRAEFGEAGLSRVIARREAQVRAAYSEALAGLAGLEDRVRRLSDLRSAEGYMAECEVLPDGSLLLVENHCPICAAARACQGFCRSELAVFEAALGPEVEVTRVDHLLAGARRCAYEIRWKRRSAA
ncbi:MAG TPA: metalloregulator ArsR/SmtB family transcription factor [Caulobacteraceae bacterium]|nr:metalloregulator ArsR/SmtB family transcription factor [Caulobacteraceae bacterium]